MTNKRKTRPANNWIVSLGKDEECVLSCRPVLCGTSTTLKVLWWHLSGPRLADLIPERTLWIPNRNPNETRGKNATQTDALIKTGVNLRHLKWDSGQLSDQCEDTHGFTVRGINCIYATADPCRTNVNILPDTTRSAWQFVRPAFLTLTMYTILNQ